MKTRTILITAMIVLSGSLMYVSAQETNQEILEIKEFHQTNIGDNLNNLVTLQYLDVFNKDRRRIAVRIYNEAGKRYYSKTFSKKGQLNVAIDISKAPQGNYIFEILNKGNLVCSKVISKQIKSGNKKTALSLFAQENSAAVIPYQTLIVDNGNNKVSIQYLDTLNDDKREIAVQIFKETGELMYTRNYLREGKLDIKYDTSEFPEGDYTFEIYNKCELVCSKVISKQTGSKTESYRAIANNEK